MKKEPYCVVLTTVPNRSEAERLAERLVEARLVACIQIQPIRSVYLWEGKVRNEPEFLLIIKTKSSVYAELEEFISSNHSYEVPEIIQLPVVAGFADYLRWIDDVVRK